jgi:hypothetical protein
MGFTTDILFQDDVDDSTAQFAGFQFLDRGAATGP